MANKQGYRGKSYRIPTTGGWNANPNIDLIPPESMTDARNINLNRGGRSTRGGVSAVNSTAITNAVQTMGSYQFRLKNGNEFILTGTTDGKIQSNYTAEIKTGLATGKYTAFETFENKAYICNGANRPQTWDGVGASTTNISSIPSDWTGSSFPKTIIKHGKGVSESLWAFGCPSNPESIYVSANGSDIFDDASVTNIPIETGDGFGIVAGVDFGDNFIAFGKKKAYIIDDSSPIRANWGYSDAQWDGGAAHERAICKTPNDLVVFDENLELYSIKAVQEYGDYAAASLTRPAYINRWIDDNIDKAQVNKFHIVYDPQLRAIKWFVVRKGQTQVDTALVFFTDRGAENGWVRHVYAEDDYASCSFLVRVSAGNYKIYTGGYNGYVYQLETSSYNDNGIYFYNGFTTPYLPIENPRLTKHFNAGWVVIVPQGTETIKFKIAIDGTAILGGYAIGDENGNAIGDENDNEIWGNTEETYTVTASPSSTLQNLRYLIGAVGNRIQSEVYCPNINESFLVSQQLFDFEYLAANPE